MIFVTPPFYNNDDDGDDVDDDDDDDDGDCDCDGDGDGADDARVDADAASVIPSSVLIFFNSAQ